MTRGPLVALLLIGLTFAPLQLALAQKPEAPAAAPATQPATKFLRFVPDHAGGGRLEAAIVRYRNPQGQVVDLVSAVHIADRSYYRDLGRAFEAYDAVLYEMVKPEGMDPAMIAEASGGGGVSALQRFLKDALELTFQLDEIDYARPNFVHADLSAEEFFAMQAERGESLIGLMLNSVLKEMLRDPDARTTPTFGIMDLLHAMQAPDRGRQLKLLLAPQFEEMDQMVAGLEGPDGSVILTERNKAAVRALEQTLKAGRRNIAIFYGAAHMADIEQRMRTIGFDKVGHEWRVAWLIPPPPASQPAPKP